MSNPVAVTAGKPQLCSRCRWRPVMFAPDQLCYLCDRRARRQAMPKVVVAHETPNSHRRWSERSADFVTSYYGVYRDSTIARRQGRSVKAIRRQANELGISHRSRFYTALAVGHIFGVQGTSAVRWIERGWLKGHRSRFVRVARFGVWVIQAKEIRRLIREHPELCDFKLMDQPGNAYWVAYARKHQRATGRRPIRRDWTPREDTYIINHRHQRTATELGQTLGRSAAAVKGRVAFLRAQGRFLPYKAAYRARVENGTAGVAAHWTPAADAYLKRHWGQATRPEIAAVLGITARQVETRADALGLSNQPRFTGRAAFRWTPQEDAYLIANYHRERGAAEPGYGKRITAQELADHFGCTCSAVKHRVVRLGLTKKAIEEARAVLDPQTEAEPVAVLVPRPREHPWRRLDRELYRRRSSSARAVV